MDERDKSILIAFLLVLSGLVGGILGWMANTSHQNPPERIVCPPKAVAEVPSVLKEKEIVSFGDFALGDRVSVWVETGIRVQLPSSKDNTATVARFRRTQEDGEALLHWGDEPVHLRREKK